MVELHVPVTRSFHLEAAELAVHGTWLLLFKYKEGVEAACAFDTPGGLGNIVLGRYTGTVVAWARLLYK